MRSDYQQELEKKGGWLDFYSRTNRHQKNLSRGRKGRAFETGTLEPEPVGKWWSRGRWGLVKKRWPRMENLSEKRGGDPSTGTRGWAEGLDVPCP